MEEMKNLRPGDVILAKMSPNGDPMIMTIREPMRETYVVDHVQPAVLCEIERGQFGLRGVATTYVREQDIVAI
jgi:hypothetical protein